MRQLSSFAGSLINPLEWRHQFLTSPAGEERRIVIRALNYDNQREVDQLVELFALQFGGHYGYQKVYFPEFWHKLREDGEETSSIVSIVAVEHDQFVAHLAVRTDYTTRAAEILFTAIHPELKEQIFQLGRLFWEFLLEQAERQNWRLVYHYNLTSNSTSELVATRCFRSVVTALIPTSGRHLRSSEKAHAGQLALLAMFNNLERSTSAPTLFPPSRHAGKIGQIYKELKLKRRMELNPTAGRADVMPNSVPDYEPRQDVHQEQLGIFELNIDPSAVLNDQEALDYLSPLAKLVEKEGKQLCVKVALDDPACPSFSEKLEDAGFFFCGILPVLSGRDRLIYSRFNLDQLGRLNLCSARAQTLRDYMATFG